MFIRRRTLKKILVDLKILEDKVEELTKKSKKKYIHELTETDEDIPVAQIIDEWQNGAKEGEK
jgi:hypothetical protein